MAIHVYNTLTRKKEELVSREKGKIAMYVCGPTVYNYIHVGNARTFLNFDVIRRYLEFSGFQVTYVENVTDVDDKIIGKAAEERSAPEVVAEKYRLAYEEDMKALGIRPPDVAPRATDHIPRMLEVIQGLLEKGYAYESEGDVYFEVSKFPAYGKLSRRNLDEQRATCHAGEESRRKRDPFDFALWKASKPGEPSWDSNWGPGRPGWHIECSTMSLEYLGNDFDIHGGGQDLIFPHHENEIAQAEAFSDGSRFVRYWLHSGMLNIDQEKMSKSLGNIKLLREVLAEHDADTIRMLALGTHYRSPLSFSDDSLDEARASCERIKNCLFNLDDILKRYGKEKATLLRTKQEAELMTFFQDSEDEFGRAMDDDFNSAAALGVIFGLVKAINAYASEVSAMKTPVFKLVLMEARRLLELLCGALGLFQGEPEDVPPEERARATAGTDAGRLIDILLEVRQAARESKNYELADMIRERLAELGIRVEDVKDGYRWRPGG